MNIWKHFENLTRDTDLRIATVITVHEADSTVEDAGGQQYRALGTSVAEGTNCYVKDGTITGKAPNLSDAGVLYV